MKEIERRVSLSDEQIEEVLQKLANKGAVWRHAKRLIVDLSGDLEARERTVMVRSNDGQVELVVKSGNALKTEREEAVVQLSASVAEALRYVALMAYDRGDYGFRTMRECSLDGINYSIRTAHKSNDPSQVVGHNFEVELEGEGTIEQLDSAITELGLTPMTDEQTREFFQHFHDNAHTPFEYSEQAAKVVELAAREFFSKDAQ